LGCSANNCSRIQPRDKAKVTGDFPFALSSHIMGLLEYKNFLRADDGLHSTVFGLDQ